MRIITSTTRALGLASTLVLAVGCCDPGLPNQRPDSGPLEGPDMTPAPDSGPAGDCQAGQSSAGCAHLVASGPWQLQNVTSDGYAFVRDDGGALSVVRLADGHVDRLRDSFLQVWAFGEVAIIMHDSTTSLSSAADLWSARSGLRPLDASVNRWSAASLQTDGTYVAWLGNLSATGDRGDVLLGRVDGSTAPMTLLSQVRLGGDCWVSMRMRAGRLIADACGADDATRSVTSFKLDGGEATTLLSPARSFLVDRAGERVLVAAPDGTTQLVAPDGSAATPFVTGFADGELLPDGSAVIYTDSDGSVWRAPVDGTAAIPLQAPGVDLWYELSKDGRFGWYSTMSDDAANMDAWLATLDHSAAPRALSMAKDSTLLGDGFTRDGNFVLWASGVNDDFVGKIFAASTDGGAPRQLATTSSTLWAVGKSGIVYTDHALPGTNGESATVHWVDLASGAEPVELAAGIGPTVWVTADEHSIVYVTGGEHAALFTLALP